MIVSFSVSNYRSFCREQSISFVASNRLSGNHSSHATSIPNSKERVLKAGIIYGANGAGKSNLLRAIKYFRFMALTAQPKNGGTEREAFKLNIYPDEPSDFDMQFIVAKKLYRLGFKVDDKYVREEWLVRIDGSQESVIYERTTDSEGNVKVLAPKRKNTNEKFEALRTVGGPQNQLFLATVRATLNQADIMPEFKDVIQWLSTGLIIIDPATQPRGLGNLLEEFSEFREFAGSFLNSASTGVDRLIVQKTKIKEEELLQFVSKERISRALKETQTSRNGTAVIRSSAGQEYLIQRRGDVQFFRLHIQAGHTLPSGDEVNFELSDESDGTRRLLDLMPALYRLQTRDAVYVIDEIDRSMHPALVWKFLEFFLKSCETGNRQVIVTTHESNLLDMDLLRRDEIWFVEKDAASSSQLYSLADFKVRKDLEIRKHYLQGRFGAIPFLGNVDRLLNDVDNRE